MCQIYHINICHAGLLLFAFMQNVLVSLGDIRIKLLEINDM